MTNKLLKNIAKGLAVLIMVIILLIAIVPFFIPIRPLEGLVSAQQVATENSQFIRLPFEGTDGIDVHYLSDNLATTNGPTFVLLHGSLLNAFSWNQVMDFFAERGRVVAYDQIPYGLSEKLVEGDWSGSNPYTSTATIEQLFSFLDALNLDQVVLVGNSYGATLAIQAAATQPERIEAMILIDSAVYVNESMPTWVMDLPQVRRLSPLLGRMFGSNEAFLKQMYAERDKLTEERLALTKIHTRVAAWDLAMWEYLRAWTVDSPDFETLIAGLNQPALVIAGEEDDIIPVDDSRRLNAELANSDLILLPSCGHVPQEECPDALEAAIHKWLIQTMLIP